MKKQKQLTAALLIAILLGCGFLTQAQDNSPRLGFRLAPNVGWLKPDVDDYENDGAVFGFSWGFISEFPFAENYAFSSGFNIVFNNGKLNYDHRLNDVNGTLFRRYNFKYLELPLMMRMRTADRGGPMFYAQIGLGTGILLDAKAEDKFENEPKEAFKKINTEVTLLRASMLVGLGVEYPVGATSRLLAGFQFNNGFTNVLKGTNLVNTGTDHAAMPNFIEFNLGFLF